MRRTLLLVSLWGLALGCQAEPPPGVLSSSRQPIVNGQLDAGHPGVVALTIQGQQFCTGTLVTPTVVVSAAHCIHPSTGVSPGTLAQIFFGSVVGQDGVFVDVIEAEYKPDWSLDDPDADDDVAVLRLASPAPVAPIPMAAVPPPGSTLTLVGFGITSAGGTGSGVKRVAQANIDQIGGKIFSMLVDPSGTCSGDSGGTALFVENGVEKFVGIHTRSDCESFMLDERVDAHLDSFIQPFIDKAGSCEADGACASGCDAPDPDCPCADDGFCTAACSNVASDPDCDPACAGDGVCAPDCPAPDPDCPVCVADGECVDACPADPDCSTGAGGSGGAADPGGGEEDEEGDAGLIDSGCGCALEAQEPVGRFPAWLLALGLMLRRRSGSSSSASPAGSDRAPASPATTRRTSR